MNFESQKKPLTTTSPTIVILVEPLADLLSLQVLPVGFFLFGVPILGPHHHLPADFALVQSKISECQTKLAAGSGFEHHPLNGDPDLRGTPAPSAV